MSTRLPTNISFACTKKSLTGLPANLEAASNEQVTMMGAPVGRLFNITFKDRYSALADGDLLVNEADATDTYRIRGVKYTLGPRLLHTHCLAERGGSK